MTETTSAPGSLPFTGDPDADRLLAEDPFALLMGFALDQQVTVQKAFSGPADLKRRLGHLDPARIAAMDPGELDGVFRERPAIHRFPGSMAGKTRPWPRPSYVTTTTTREASGATPPTARISRSACSGYPASAR